MTNSEKVKNIATLSPNEQADIMRVAARRTKSRSVRGNSRDRFYAHECGLSPKVVKAMRDEGHGEKIYSGSGANSGRWYFPIEILDAASASLSSSHARIILYEAIWG